MTDEEPFFVRKTFDPHNVASGEASNAWFKEQILASARAGGAFSRGTIAKDKTGLLFECWQERPKDQGDLRWDQEDRPHDRAR